MMTFFNCLIVIYTRSFGESVLRDRAAKAIVSALSNFRFVCVLFLFGLCWFCDPFPCFEKFHILTRLQIHKWYEYVNFNPMLQGRIQDFEMGGEFCNNVREIKYYFNI